jgi:hypothetical protein
MPLLATGRQPLTDTAAAEEALLADGGCTKARAAALATAVSGAAAEEALGIVAGSILGFGSALDRRVATLDRIIQLLDHTEPFPSAFEIGVIFRITPGQARNVLRTYHARFSGNYRLRLESSLANLRPRKERHDDTNVFVFEFDDPASLDYAVEKLRRRGLTRGVTQDTSRLRLVVDRGEEDRHGKTADIALGEP